ncbi:MAG: hypothetical protein R3F13_08260 [Prosthecobacter sp.]
MASLWIILTTIVSAFLAAGFGFWAWYKWMTRKRRPIEAGYKYVMVTDDGGARELTADEREYLEAEFSPTDGARPYIKFRYESLDGWGSLAGFLARRQLPSWIAIRKPTECEEQSCSG